MTWRHVLFILICSLAVLLFWIPLTTVCRLSQHQEMYSHTLMIVPMSLGLVHLKRKKIFRDVHYSLGLGVVLVFTGMVLDWLSRRPLPNLNQNDYLSLAVFSFLVVLIGGFVLCYGSKAVRSAAFPLAFLLLMVPIPGFLAERMVFALQKGSAEVTDALFRLSGVPFFREGFTFSLGNVTIEIAHECSGIRSSLALFITSLLAGHVFLRSNWRRVFLSVLVILVAIIKNGVRIVTLSLLAAYVDEGFLTGSLHHRYGGVALSLLALAVLVPVLWLLQRQERSVQSDGPGRRQTKGRFVPELEGRSGSARG